MFLTKLFDDPLHYAIVVAVVIVSITLHELGHAIAATWEGDPTPRIRGHLTWNPIVHMGWKSIVLLLLAGLSYGLTPVSPAYFRHRRWGEVIVAFAGPAVNLGLAAVAALMLTGTTRFDTMPELARVTVPFWSTALAINVSLFVLNMIPLPPLDGFTVAEGSFHLGDLGPALRRLFPWTLLGAWFLFRSGPVQDGVESVIYGMFHAAERVWELAP